MKTAETFDWSLIRSLAGFCQRAYQERTCSDPGTGASAFVTLDEFGDIIVAFKGSSKPKDFVQDGEIFRVRFPEMIGAEVHRGFLADWYALKLTVISQVNTYLALNRDAKVYVTGHSLGGALAVLCAWSLSLQLMPVTGVYTFGCPRVGDAAFREIYNRSLYYRTFHVVNQNDIVARLPGWLLGYRREGQIIFLLPQWRGAAQWQLNPSLLYRALCDAMGLYGAFRNLDDVLVRDHFIAAYLKSLSDIN